jgi:hypothetical protein
VKSLRAVLLVAAVLATVAASALAQSCSSTLPLPQLAPMTNLPPPALAPTTNLPAPQLAPGSATGLALGQGLIAYWKLDDGSGTSVADTKGSNTGTWQGTLGSQWTAGKLNGGGSFDGGTNYIGLGTPSGFDAAPLTISLWFRTTAPVSNQIYVIMGKGTLWPNSPRG